MGLQDTITVVEQSAPRITKQLSDFRNDSLTATGTFGTAANQNPVVITGYTFQLLIKRTPIGIRAQDGRAQTYDEDVYALTYNGTILDPDEGTFYFQLDANATACYGTYVAEIRWWASGVSTLGAPSDRVLLQFNVNRRLSSTYP